ncbi:hypothetical protein [Helicobacter ganmani]
MYNLNLCLSFKRIGFNLKIICFGELKLNSVGNFAIVLGILCLVSIVVLAITAISVSKSGGKLTSFEKKILFAVAFLLCSGIILLYIFSNLSLFFALFS